MKKTLRISEELSLPLDAITQTFGIVGQRASGSMGRRDFLSTFALGAAGLFAPRRAYSFIWAPLAPVTFQQFVVPLGLYVDATGAWPSSYRTFREAEEATNPGGVYIVRVMLDAALGSKCNGTVRGHDLDSRGQLVR